MSANIAGPNYKRSTNAKIAMRVGSDSDIDIGQDPRFGCGTLRAVRAGKPWRQGLPDCYVGRLDALKRHYTS
jgi:hypothetical protein